MTNTLDIDLALREAVALYDKSQVFLLTDENVAKHCLPVVLQTLDIPSAHILTIPVGDENKNINTLMSIWHQLSDLCATRKALLLNLGGGVVTDMGGFAASTFKRGIDFVNIPTTLLAAVDAATGGKCGINFNSLKNEIGIIRQAKQIIVYTPFFNTLSPKQFLSGYAEMLKHALISSALDTNLLLSFPIEEFFVSGQQAIMTDDDGEEYVNPLYERLMSMINRSLEIKQYIIEQDFEEAAMRKSLNFGHTIGHALEELSLSKENPEEPLSHGFAVMYGIVAELYLSVAKVNFPKEMLQRIVSFVTERYGKPLCNCKDYETLYQLMLHDKKNTSVDEVNFTLLANVGSPRINQTADKTEIFEALDFLFNL